MTEKVWEPSEQAVQSARLTEFQTTVGRKHGVSFPSYRAFHKWSVDFPELFWAEVADFCQIHWIDAPEVVFDPPEAGRMLGGTWFPGASLNFAQNMLRGMGDDATLISYCEGGERRQLSKGDLADQVAAVVSFLQDAGIKKGDRVAGVMSNTPEAIVAMLASAAIGAVWSSCSPDFGVGGIVDRLGQVAPRVLFFTPAYQYGGKFLDASQSVAKALGELSSVEKVVAVPIPGLGAGSEVNGALGWSEVLSRFARVDGAEIPYAALPFDHPLYIMFSSGTTGVPKCIVHGAGGTLLQHKKELVLHCDLGPEDRLLYFTTCGWMMWNWMASALSTGASLSLFEGAVHSPRPDVLWEVVEQDGVSVFGTSPKYLSFCQKREVLPRVPARPLKNLRMMLSTGSPLLPEHFSWVKQHLPEVHLASISGGTDIISCFMLGIPTLPVFAGQIQGPGLGMAVDAWDETGRAVRGEKGELVCTKPFPSMPVGFWGDDNGEKYHSAYFDFYSQQEVWRHGDYIEIDEQTGGISVFGRSDATLNPGGVRIGTAELYRHVESLDEVVDSIAIARPIRDDVEIVLFLKLGEGVAMGESLRTKVCQQIRAQLTPRHVPAHIFQVTDIPYTRSGKKVELAVAKAFQGEKIENRGALANPNCLDEFLKIGQLASVNS